MRTLYRRFCQFEMLVAATLLMFISGLVFVSAIARTLRSPLNWAVDISMLLFAWLVFLGGDIVIRETNLISVDVFQKMLSPALRKGLQALFYIAMIVFLVILVRYGIPLLLQNWKRQFQVLPISYSWCTLSVPVGSVLMIISTLGKLRDLLLAPAEKKGE